MLFLHLFSMVLAIGTFSNCNEYDGGNYGGDFMKP